MNTLIGKRVISLTAAVLLAPCLAMPVQVAAQDDEAIFDGPINSTVRVRSLSTGRSGTGWVIAAADEANRAGAAVIVTSLNTIEGSTAVIVREPNANVDRDATILAVDTDRNLVLLEVKDISAKQIALTRTMPKVGRSVWATGYSLPADRAEGWRLAVNATIKGGRLGREYRGPISVEARADTNQLEHDAALVPGYEGGPLLDKCGRVVGVNMKSGGDIGRRSRMRIQPTAAIMNALRADEVIAFAKSSQVEPEILEGASCSGAAAANVAPPAGTAKPVPIASTTGQGSSSSIFSNSWLLGLLVILGLAIAAFGFFYLSRRPKDAEPAPQPKPQPGTQPKSGTQAKPGASNAGTTLAAGAPKGTTREATLRLSGRGPEGEAISLDFGATMVKAKPATLGVGANADVKIPDNRTEYKVSRMHAKIGSDGTNFTIEDNKSLNGTKLNGKLLEPHKIETIVNGDVISLADLDLKASIV